MDGFLLSGDDIATLRGLVEQERRRVKNPPVDHLVLDEDPLTAPEVYVCLTPPGGIPGLTPDKNVGTGTGSGTHWRVGAKNTPGSALCPIYQVLITHGIPDLMLVDGVYPPTVYNLSETTVPGTTWILAVRDKFGSWFAVENGGGGSDEDTPIPFVAVTKVCLSGSTLTVQYSLFDPQHNVLSTWCQTNPTGCCTAGTGTGTISGACCGDSMADVVCARITNVSGAACLDGIAANLYRVDPFNQWANTHGGASRVCPGRDFVVDGSLIMSCQNGNVWEFGIFGVAGGGGVSTTVHCGPPFSATFNNLAVTFFDGSHGVVNVSVAAGVCGGSGTGTGTGTGGGGLGPVITACCLLGLPTTLHATISNTSGCACLAGTYPFVWNGVDKYVYSGTVCGNTLGLALVCSGGSWFLQMVCGAFAGSWTADSVNCSTPTIVFNGAGIGLSITGACCTGTISVTIGA